MEWVLCSFSEIYNEKVFDLLGEKRDSLPLVMNGDSVFVKGLSESRVRSESVGMMSRCTTRTMCIG